MKFPKFKFRFGLRGFLICVPLIGVGLGIFAREKRLADDQADIVEHLNRLGFSVIYRPHGESLFGTRSEPGFWRRWLGDDMFDCVVGIDGRTAVMSSEVNDESLIESVPLMRKLPNGFALVLFGSGISAAGVRSLTDIPYLKSFALSNFVDNVSGAFDFLCTLPELKQLDFADTSISDFEIDTFANMRQLEALDVRRTALSKDGINRLRHAMPNCVILADDAPHYVTKQGGSR